MTKKRNVSYTSKSADLERAMLNQAMVGHDRNLAAAFASCVETKTFSPGEKLMIQGDVGDGVHFILRGQVQIGINDHREALRGEHQHVGEMAMLDQYGVRSATVTAVMETQTAFVKREDFLRICDDFPLLYKPIAITLNNRMRERAKNIRKPNPVPSLFIASSKESIRIVERLEKAIHCDQCDVQKWASDDVFEFSKTNIESLVRASETSDFALIIFNPDDRVKSRRKRKWAPRDNVIFEHGLFAGTLTRHRTFFLIPSNIDLKIPSDLAGMTPIAVPFGRRGPSKKTIDEVAERIRKAISSLGPRTGYFAPST